MFLKTLWVLCFVGVSYGSFAQKTSPISATHGLRTTIYKVGDIDSARQWYTKAFGQEPYFNEPFYVGFNIGGYELGLQPDATPAASKTRSVVSYWAVDDIDATYQYLLSIGAQPHEEPTQVGGELMTGTVLDPWGNILGIIYNPYFKMEEE
ncbi:MAG: VOC family protein [Bacteroidota bacterium]